MNLKDSKAWHLIIQSVSDETLIYINKENTAAKMMKTFEYLFAQQWISESNTVAETVVKVETPLKDGENSHDCVSKILHLFEWLASCGQIFNDNV